MSLALLLPLLIARILVIYALCLNNRGCGRGSNTQVAIVDVVIQKRNGAALDLKYSDGLSPESDIIVPEV